MFGSHPSILFLLLCSYSLLASQVEVSDPVVARVGDTFISEKEFIQRYELLPGLNRTNRSHRDVHKSEFLISLLAEKLLVEEAKKKRFHESKSYQVEVQEVAKLFARDELYREEVRNKVSVSEREILLEIARAKVEVLAGFLYFPDRAAAEFVKHRIKNGDDFDTMEFDSSLHAVRDTATVIWGDADVEVEEAAYTLQAGEVSDLVAAGDGYYIIKALQRQRSSFYSSMQPSVLHDRVKEALRTRKERQRAYEFVQSTLETKSGHTNPGTFRVLSDALVEAFRKESSNTETNWLTEHVYRETRRLCSERLRDTISVAGDRAWTIEDIVDRLYRRGFGLREVHEYSIRRTLNEELRALVHQELLAQEALKKGLDQRLHIRQQVAMWADAYLASMMKEEIRRQIRVSDGDVYAFLRHEGSAQVPLVRLRELRTRSLEEMEVPLAMVQQGLPFVDVVLHWSPDSSHRERKGLTDFFPITMRAPLGERAWGMSVGEQDGPFQDGEEFVYFEVVEKKNDSLQITLDFEEARKQVRRQKEERAINRVLSQAVRNYRVDVYADRLKQIKVSPVPMMTFRYLGFGGRLFAVPFVEPLIDWVNIDPDVIPHIP